MKKLRAFTLVELLVVIGVIAVLISILLPALSRSLAAARAVQCQSNLRQIAMWGMQYATEYSGWLPSRGENPPSLGGSGLYWWEISNTNWADKAGPYGLWKSGAAFGTTMHCPEAVATVMPLRGANGAGAYFSNYGLNQYLGGGHTSSGGKSGPMPKVKLLTDKAFWFGDTRIFYSGGWDFHPTLGIDAATGPSGGWPWNWQNPGNGGTSPPTQFKGHPNRTNYFVFGDGHCSGVTQNEFLKMSTKEQQIFGGYPF